MNLKQHLAQTILLDGPQRVSSLMELALAHPREGYYTAHPAIGGDGDFLTAPEISQVFGEVLGAFVLQTWIDMGEPNEWALVELGPGRGTLMQDMLRVLKLRPQALEGLELTLVELSPRLSEEQRRRTAEFDVETKWADTFTDLPQSPLAIIANEFFDALPIRQFWRQGERWFERRVCLKGSDIEEPEFELVFLPANEPLGLTRHATKPLPEKQVIETSLAAESYASMIAQHLARYPGRALIIDYGYSGETHGDTLQAIAGHKKLDVLDSLGAADLSAHVDFGALAQVARSSGARVEGPAAQGALLERLGIGARFAALAANASDADREILSRQHRRLTAPDAMGELFKALLISSPNLPPTPGFSND